MFGGLLIVGAEYVLWGPEALDHWATDWVPLSVWASGFGIAALGFMAGARAWDLHLERMQYGLPAEDLLRSAAPPGRQVSADDASARQSCTVACAPADLPTDLVPLIVPDLDFGSSAWSWPPI